VVILLDSVLTQYADRSQHASVVRNLPLGESANKNLSFVFSYIMFLKNVYLQEIIEACIFCSFDIGFLRFYDKCGCAETIVRKQHCTEAPELLYNLCY
jgi:hypothetical protein